MELHDKQSTVDQQELLRIDFSYAVAALSIDVVENIIALRPRVVNHSGKSYK